MTGGDVSAEDVRADAEAAVLRARKILRARQDADGCWPGLSAEDVTPEAECLLARELLGLRTPERTSAIAQQLRSRQHADGSWSGGDLSASVLAYLALRLAGDSADAYHLAVAAGWIRDAGGLAAVSVSCQVWLALFGLAEWQDVHVPAPEGFFRSARHGDWAGLSRQPALALAILGTLRTVRRLPFELTELRGGQEAGGAERRFRLRVPPVGLAKTAETVVLRKCGQWIIDWQQREGLPSSPRPIWAGALVALHAIGYPLTHPVLADGLAWLDSVTARPRHLAGQPRVTRRPPVSDTVAAIEALADAGTLAADPTLTSAARWLLGERISGPADGPGPAPAGWSFGADGYPVVADTGHLLIALSRVAVTGRAAIQNAVRWLASVQSRDGSWAGSAAVTATVVQALATHAQPEAKAIRRGVVWLLLAQQPDGCWPARSGENELEVTASVLSALLVAGVRPAKPVVTAAARWLADQQNPDGGWPAAPAGRSEQRRSDAPGTAIAVSALLAASQDPAGIAPDAGGPVGRGVSWLVRSQQADGGWGDKPAGRNGPRRRSALAPGLVLPLRALGRYVQARAAADRAQAEAQEAGSVRLGLRLSDSAEPARAAGD